MWITVKHPAPYGEVCIGVFVEGGYNFVECPGFVLWRALKVALRIQLRRSRNAKPVRDLGEGKANRRNVQNCTDAIFQDD